MSKAEKLKGRVKYLERELDRLVRCGAIHRAAQSRRIAQLTMDNRNMRKGFKGLWLRWKAWRRRRQ